MSDPIENQAPTSEQASTDQGASESAVEGQEIALGEQQTDVQGTESTEQAETQDAASEENIDNLPKPAQEQVKSMLRRMHQATQETAQLKRELAEMRQIVSDPKYQEYLKAKQLGQQTEQLAQQHQYEVTERDWEEAQTDPTAFASVVNKLAGQQVQQLIQQYAPVIQDLQHRVNVADAERTVDAFASQHPDFYDIDRRVMDAAIRMSVQQGGGIAEAYNIAKEIEKGYYDKAQSKMKTEVQKKKLAVTNPPTRSANPSVVHVSKEDAMRVAIENAALGKKVEVRRKG